MGTPRQVPPSALLIVTMEPPSDFEDEFNDWYDFEHFPQRATLPGFGEASRWVCLDGWPRYLALYDLESAASVETPEYFAVSGPGATPWTRRIVSRTLGRLRVVAEEIGNKGSPGRTARLLAARYPTDDRNAARTLLQTDIPGRQRIRCLQSGGELWLIAAFERPVLLPSLVEAFGAVSGVGATLFNLYVPYLRGA